MISRREVLAAGLAAAPAAFGQRTRKRPNFLFLIADDHAGYVLGADGNKQARTPNLDRFATEGCRFAQHICNSPVCTPSRQSFFTGQLPHAAGVTVLQTPLDDSRPTLAKQLSAAGYKTAVFGKMHFNRPGTPGLHGFQTILTENEATRNWQKVASHPVASDIRTKPVWRPFKDPARIWLNAEKLPFPRSDAEMRSTWITTQAIDYLEQHRGDEFALWISLQEPHSPFDFPVEDREFYKPGDFPIPKPGPEDDWQIPLIFRDLSDAEKQGIAAAYYTSVRFLDRNMGRILSALRRLNLEEDTFVVYMADHGYSLGQHGRFEKHCSYEPALRVPLIMRWPGRIRQDVVHDMTQSVDVPATILDLLGADPLPVQHGRSLRPYLTGGRRPDPLPFVFNEYLENEEACLRTPRWKFVHCSGKRARKDGYATANPTPGRYVRLYDRSADPNEFHDVSAAHPQMVKQFQAEMLAVFRRTHPEAEKEPKTQDTGELLDWYLRPRDAG
ncbi:MAG TPA: sulfatase-like hydrolase/transferase [Bryobacteraceae bacterium]|nr:sulfatase-like hydrolase/transferase [Bryobacteraceae bacterium]